MCVSVSVCVTTVKMACSPECGIVVDTCSKPHRAYHIVRTQYRVCVWEAKVAHSSL